MSSRPLHLFALDASRSIGQGIGEALGLALSAHEERAFADGEHRARPLVSVRGGDVFVVQSLYADGDQSINDKLCRLLFFIGALRDAHAARITAVVPYLCYARKDRQTQPRDPVTTRYVARLFEAVDVDRVMTVDVHNLAAFQNAFRCATEHIEARNLFVHHLAGQLRPGAEVTVVAPDAGGIARAERFRDGLGTVLGRDVPSAFVEKKRTHDGVSGGRLAGEVEGRTAIIVDDLISTGGTLIQAIEACQSAGAAAIYAAATHGLFTGGAQALLAHDALDQLIVTNTIPPFRLDAAGNRDKLTVLNAAGLLGDAIHRVHTGGSLTELMAL